MFVVVAQRAARPRPGPSTGHLPGRAFPYAPHPERRRSPGRAAGPPRPVVTVRRFRSRIAAHLHAFRRRRAGDAAAVVAVPDTADGA